MSEKFEIEIHDGSGGAGGMGGSATPGAGGSPPQQPAQNGSPSSGPSPLGYTLDESQQIGIGGLTGQEREAGNAQRLENILEKLSGTGEEETAPLGKSNWLEFKAGLDIANEAVQHFGSAVRGVGSLDMGQALMSVGQAAPMAGKGLAELGIISEGAGAALGAFGLGASAAVGSAIALGGALSSTVERFAALNAPLAAAQAMAQVAQIQGDVRRAEQLGPELAHFEGLKSEMSQQSQDAMAALLKETMPLIIVTMRGTIEAIKVVSEIVGDIKGLAISIGEGVDQKLGTDIMGILKRIKEGMDKESREFAARNAAMLDEINRVITTGGGFDRGPERDPHLRDVPNQMRNLARNHPRAAAIAEAVNAGIMLPFGL